MENEELSEIRNELTDLQERIRAAQVVEEQKGYKGVPHYLKRSNEHLSMGLNLLILGIEQARLDQQALKSLDQMAGRKP